MKAGSKVPATDDGSTSKPPVAKDPLPSIAPTSTSASKGPSKSGDPATRKTGAADAIVGRLVLSTIPEEDQQEGDEGDEEDEGDREPGLGLVSEDDLGHANVFGDSEREEDEEEEVADLSEDFESPSSDDNPDSDVEPLSSLVEPPKKKGKVAAKAKAVVSMLDSKCFIVGVIVNHTHFLKPTSTLHIVKTTIHEVLGLYAIPEEKRAGLVTHFYKDPAKRCFALETEDDWITLKDEWASQVAKRTSEAAIEIVLMPKFFQFLEEAVRAQTVTASKPKAKKKELVNPFLTPKPPNQTEHPLHKCGLDDTKTKAYQAQLKQLLATCEPTAPQQIPPPPPININFPPELIQILRPSSQPPKRMRSRSPPSSDHVASPDVEANPLLRNTPTPTIGVWLAELEAEGLQYSRFDFLQGRFAEEESLGAPITSIAWLAVESLKALYGLKAGDALFLTDQLRVAGKRYGFQVGDQEKGAKKAKHH
ncbi:hypothetical protein JB92DRAFT_3109917 [Gautieria morchelliformis]|nr:hypothetical protein JB92DRAFT_3109917 [Gautieria morchelliformis]